MALSNSDKREIEVMIRKEIKDFLDSNTLKQFENKMIQEKNKENQSFYLTVVSTRRIVRTLLSFLRLYYYLWLLFLLFYALIV